MGKPGISVKRRAHNKLVGLQKGSSGTIPEASEHSRSITPVVTRLQSKRLARQSEGRAYQITEVESTENMWNDAFCSHNRDHPQCTNPIFRQKIKTKQLVSITASVECTSCSFVSKPHKLYKTVAKSGPGRKQSTLNVGQGLALVKSPIGATVYQEINLTMGIDPGSHSGLQSNINNASVLMTQIGEQNRASICERISSLDKPIHASGDGAYRTRVGGGGNTPFEASTQQTFNVTEENTGLIIGLDTQSKLCTAATKLRHQGHTIVCPYHAGECTATLAPSDSIGNEGRSLRIILAVLQEFGIDISHYTSDGDCSIGKALHEYYAMAIWLKDSKHFQSSHFVHLKRINFSDALFEIEKEVMFKSKARVWFCEDLSDRASAEFTAAVEMATGETTNDEEIKNILNTVLSETPSAIIRCYQNDCSLCEEHSLVCSGRDDGGRWQCGLMTQCTRRNLNMTNDDEEKLHEGLLFRLGPAAVNQTYLNTNSQANEAVNRVINKCLPKDLVFTRNFRGRANAACTTFNQGPGGLSLMCQEKAGHQVSEKVKHKLEMHDNRIKNQRAHKKKPEVKARRVSDRQAKHNLYENARKKNPEKPDTEVTFNYKKRGSLFSSE